MVKALKHGLMGVLSSVIIIKEESRGKEFTIGLMELSTQEIGLTMYLKEKVF